LESLRNIRELIAGKHGNPQAVRGELARHIESITFLPEGEGREIRYKGSWKLLGDADGAEGTARSVLPPELRPTIPFGGIFKRVA
jgi:hypothetical protein